MPTQTMIRYQNITRLLFTLLRIFIGWHFLYEGIAKLFSPWSSAGYLMESQWLLSGVFNRIAENPVLLQTVDLLNIIGLILVGIGLFLGLFTRVSAAVGAFLILLFYIANPPFIGYLSETTGEGHYLIVNKQLIEMGVLILFIFLPKEFFWSLERWISRFRRNRVREKEGKHSIAETSMGRRELLKDLLAIPFAGGFAWIALKKKQWESFEERSLVSKPSRVDAVSGSTARAQFATLDQLKQKVPTGKIKGYEISRLICGGNLISGYAHSRDLIYVSHLVQSYFSDEKVLETFKLCEAVGINTMIVRVDNNTLRVLEKYRRRGGEMQWIAQCKATDEDIKSDIDASVANGAIGVYLHGGVCDSYVRRKRVDHLLTCLEHMKKYDHIICGLAGHDIRVIIECEKHGLDPDFYMKTLNSGNYWTAGPRLVTDPEWKPDPMNIVESEYGADVKDNIWSVTPQQTVEFMKKVEKPWISYKVLGAGAIPPKEGFSYAFKSGADFACVGMFDFQIVEDANIISDVLTDLPERTRPWRA
ncbi:MAG: DoxX family protein [Bacteroidales bacterium]|nr:DoxX family protein [Bacteroidales bacterium]